MNTLIEIIQMGGPAMPVLILLFLLFVPCLLAFGLYSLVARPSRRRVRIFARVALVASVVFILVGLLGFARGTWILDQALASGEVADTVRLQAIGMKEARVPLWTGLLFAGIALSAGGFFFRRSGKLDGIPSGSL